MESRPLFRGEFASFYPPGDLTELWGRAWLVPDANILLHFHRSNDDFQSTLLEALALFKGRIFIPHQVALEYHQNRLSVLESQNDNALKGAVEKAVSAFSKELKSLGQTRGDIAKLVEDVKSFVKSRTESLPSVDTRNFGKLLTEDRVESIFAELGAEVGKAANTDQARKWQAEAKARADSRRPPGFKDASKELQAFHKGRQFEKFCGDFFVWEQTLQRFEGKGLGVIFVTDDAKPDWWEAFGGQKLGPRRELREEAEERGIDGFWMYRVLQFLEAAKSMGNVQVTPAVASQASALADAEASRWMASSEMNARAVETVRRARNTAAHDIFRVWGDDPHMPSSFRGFSAHVKAVMTWSRLNEVANSGISDRAGFENALSLIESMSETLCKSRSIFGPDLVEPALSGINKLDHFFLEEGYSEINAALLHRLIRDEINPAVARCLAPQLNCDWL
jgi:hypothetical protein